MRRHGPARDQDDKTWYEVSLRPSIPLSAQPDASQTSAPPDNAHSRVLDIIPNPSTSPPMLSESVHTTPCGNEERVEEFLRSSRPLQPRLTNEHDNRKDDAVSDEGTSHNKMGKALSQMVIPAVP